MKTLSIAAKIWISVGIFVAGFVLATVLGQIQGLSTERTMRDTSQALFPSAQRSQSAEAAFQRVVKGFSDAVIMQDAAGLDRASEDGRLTVEDLRGTAGVAGLSAERASDARKLADQVEQYVGEARTVYGAVLGGASLSSDSQAKMQALAGRKDGLAQGLENFKKQCSDDLKQQLAAVQASSASQRWLALGVFGATLLVSGILVHLTVRRAITGPILRVIRGLNDATEQTNRASGEVAQSGKVVVRDAQEQAACIQETSASLEEISATTRQNADRAVQADQFMRDALGTADKAGRAMNDLKASMDAIAKSSDQVAAVLKSIDEIAFHTNILALNAAVEAARAGEAGASFSVVADEVRSLAQRAAEAARRSGEIVEKTIGDVKTGVSLVALTHNAVGDVSQKLAGGSRMVAEIAAGSEEQSRGVANVSQAITRIETVTQNNVANATRSAECASDMTRQLEITRSHLNDLVTVVGMKAD